MSLITKMRKQTCVYWGAPRPDGFGGQAYDYPIEISCRWEDKQELFIDTAGKQLTSTAVVYVDRDLELDGWLWLGELDAIESREYDRPEKTTNARRIKGVAKLPNLKNTESLRTIWLI